MGAHPRASDQPGDGGNRADRLPMRVIGLWSATASQARGRWFKPSRAKVDGLGNRLDRPTRAAFADQPRPAESFCKWLQTRVTVDRTRPPTGAASGSDDHDRLRIKGGKREAI
jgi:hypothetical protein